MNRRRRRFAKWFISWLVHVALAGLVRCVLECLGRIGLGLELRLGLILGCMSPVDMIFQYVCLCVCIVHRLISA